MKNNKLSRKQNAHMRVLYESMYGIRISDTTWITVKKTLAKAGLEINEQNLSKIAIYKKSSPHLNLKDDEYRDLLTLHESLLEHLPDFLTGVTFDIWLKNNGIKPHKSTIYRWFEVTGNTYSDANKYTKEALKIVVFKAAIWLYKSLKDEKKAAA